MTKQAKIYLVFLLIMAALTVPFGLAIASDITEAEYYGTLRITNTDAAAANVSVNFTANTTAWISAGILNSSANNCAIRDAGVDTAFMPGLEGNSWIVWTDSILANGNKDATLYTGNVTGGKIRYFPGTDGMTVSDDATIEISDNGSLSIKGMLNGSGTFVYKTGAMSLVYDGDNVSAVINPPPELAATMADYGVGDQLIDITDLGTVSAGDMLLINVVTKAQDDITVEDFTQVFQVDQGAGGDITHGLFYKVADGGETTVNVTLTASPYICSTLARFINATDIETSALQGGTGTGPDPPSHTASWGDYTNLWIVPLGYGDATTLISAHPSGYSDNVTTAFGGSSGPASSMAFMTEKTATENPGTYTLDNIEVYNTATVVIGCGAASANASVTAADGEQVIQMDKRPIFLGIGVDCDANTGPPTVTDNLVMNAPLWSTNLNGTTITTVDANEYVFEVTGATYSSQGRVFDGNDKIKYTVADWRSSDEEGTIIVWFKTADNGALFNSCDEATNTQRLSLNISSTYPVFYTRTGASNDQIKVSESLNDNNWHNLAVTSNGTAWKIYIDSVSKTPEVVVGSNNGNWFADVPDRDNVTFGIMELLTPTANYTGTIGEVYYSNIEYTLSEISNYYNSTAWKYIGDYTADTYEYVYSASDFDDNSSDWVLARGDVMPYMDTANITVNGVVTGSWRWQLAETYDDDSGNGNTATPTIRTSSSDSDVSAALINFSPMSLATANSTATTWPEIWTAAPTQPTTMYTENSTPGVFFYPLVHAFWSAGPGAMDDPVDEAFIWYLIAFLTIIPAGMVIFWAFVEKSKQSALLIKIMLMAAIMIFWALPGPNIYGFYVVIYFLMWCTGIMILSKNYGW